MCFSNRLLWASTIRCWYLSHRWALKIQAHLHIHAFIYLRRPLSLVSYRGIKGNLPGPLAAMQDQDYFRHFSRLTKEQFLKINLNLDQHFFKKTFKDSISHAPWLQWFWLILLVLDIFVKAHQVTISSKLFSILKIGFKTKICPKTISAKLLQILFSDFRRRLSISYKKPRPWWPCFLKDQVHFSYFL